MSSDAWVRHESASIVEGVASSSSPVEAGWWRPLSRRRLMATGVGLGGALLIAGARRQTAGGQSATPEPGHGAHDNQPGGNGLLRPAAWEPADLIEPEVRRSVNGELRTTLRVGYAYHDIGGYQLSLRTYDGRVPGPTLRAQPGDVLRIALINDLPANREELPVNPDLPHRFNTTNFHLHGGHVSPSGDSDNVLRSMEPGQSHEIEIHIPADHTRGTSWYHPHHHGSADVQISSGMVGALIVEGDFADVPEIANARERVLILSEVLFDYLGTIEEYDTLWPEAVPRFLAVNGQREPIIHMQPGEVQRWRIVDAAHENNFRLALDGHALQAIAHDGIQASHIDQHENLVIAPGQRVDLLVQAGSPGTYELKAIPNDQGYRSPTGTLAHVVVAGEPLPMALPTSLPPPPLEPVRDEELTGSRRLTLSVSEPEYPPAANYQEFAFLIDDRRFDLTRVDQHIELGAVEEWTVINDHTDDHVFHIHTNPFQVTKLNGESLSTPVWRDTVVVPREGSVTFRSRFLDFTGRTVLHCHMMNHEELGMMQLIEFSGDS
jgi:FtsP/CotA-like multicopper oxidase with cupredoxin domain